MPIRTVTLGLIVVTGAGCAQNSVDALTPVAAEACRPAETNSLADGFSAADLAGSWSLWLFGDEGDATGDAAGGRLELVAWEPDEEPLVGGAPAALHGATDVDLDAVGAADTTFAGRWESGEGRGPVAAGRFCAVRELLSDE